MPEEGTKQVMCVWFCNTCNLCHTNACPQLWGGHPENRCGHPGWPKQYTHILEGL